MHSFAVFQTTLIRDVIAVSDLFYRLGTRASQLPEARTKVSNPDFVLFRTRAEKDVRTGSTSEETTITDIWKRLVEYLGWDWTDRWVELEMCLQAESLLPVETTRRLIGEARAADGSVIFISDSYMPASFIRAQLQQFNLIQEHDRLYVSSDIGLRKTSGNLFRHVLREEGIAPTKLHHLGHSVSSDILAARRLGIVAELCDAPNLEPAETAILAAGYGDHSTIVRDMVGASRQFRQRDADVSLQGARELVGTFLGPFCTLFASWVLKAAKEQGLKRVYFMARDCQTVLAAAKVISPQYGIECRYLYVSRQALYLPSVVTCKRSEIPWLNRWWEPSRLESVLAKLELEPKDLPKPIGTATSGGTLLADTDWNELWTLLEADPLKSRVETIAAERRNDAIRYFESVGLFGPERCGIVDLGWTLGCQTSLRAILKTAGVESDILGFYLGLNDERRTPADAGPATSIFHPGELNNSGITGTFHPVQYSVWLDHIIGQATHPSTVRYSSDAKPAPVFQAMKSGGDCPERQVEQLHELIRQYAVRYSSQITANGLTTSELRGVIQSLIASFYANPGPKAITALDKIDMSSCQNNLNSIAMLQGLTWRDVCNECVPPSQRSGAVKRRDIWLEGVRYSTPKAVYRAYLSVLQTRKFVKAFADKLNTSRSH